MSSSQPPDPKPKSKPSSDNNEASAASSSSESQSSQVSYAAERVIDNGSFGVVFQAIVVETGEIVAIKKVLLDRRFRNRELKIMKMLKHPFICGMKHCFYSNGDKGTKELYLNLVLEYMPTTVYKYTRNYLRIKKKIPIICVQLLIYQLCRALAYIHAKGICHRDIKPQNLLMDTETMVLKLCDFGSAKRLKKGEPNVAYICSRYYRAPELIFGCVNYTTRIDVWSTGCVCAGLLLGQPLFPGVSGVDQLVEIIKVLGTPTKAQIFAMNRNYTEFKFPDVKGRDWSTVLTGKHIPNSAIDFVSKMLRYEPTTRFTPLGACLHPFFDNLRQDPSKTAIVLPTCGPNPKKSLPDHLFKFSVEEIDADPASVCQLVPKHARNPTNWGRKIKTAWDNLGKSASTSDCSAAAIDAADECSASAKSTGVAAAGTSSPKSKDAPRSGKDTSTPHS